MICGFACVCDDYVAAVFADVVCLLLDLVVWVVNLAAMLWVLALRVLLIVLFAFSSLLNIFVLYEFC